MNRGAPRWIGRGAASYAEVSGAKIRATAAVFVVVFLRSYEGIKTT